MELGDAFPFQNTRLTTSVFQVELFNDAEGVGLTVGSGVSVVVGVSVGADVFVGVNVTVGVGVSVGNNPLNGWPGPVSQIISIIPPMITRAIAPYTRNGPFCWRRFL